MKKVLKCTCPICGEEHELEADYVMPGVEGVLPLSGGTVTILDSTKTDRHCKICSDLITRNLVDAAIHVEVEDE